MRPSVRAAFVGFTSPMEGVVPWMYLDIKGYVTVAIGNLVDDMESMTPPESVLAMPFVDLKGNPATRAQIAEAWRTVKNEKRLARQGYRAAEFVTHLRLTEEGIERVVFAKLDEMNAELVRRFPMFEEWPADAQLATLSMAWACGPWFRFPALEGYLRALDFDGAVLQCRINEEGNPGLRPRNLANKRLFANASRVLALGLDPDVLYYPRTVEDDIVTQPEIANPASEPTIYAAAPEQSILHPIPDTLEAYRESKKG